MKIYEGVELLNQVERERQHTLTKALWDKLCECGIKSRDKGRIKGYIISKSFEMAMKIKAEYSGKFQSNILIDDEESMYLVEITSSLCYLTIEAFLELCDILMISANNTDSTFDGFEIDIEEVKKLNKPWWRLW